jgi:hypothetical protein
MASVYSISCPEMMLNLRVGTYRLWRGKDVGVDRMDILEEFLRVTQGNALVYHSECDSTPSMLDDVYLEEFEMGRDYRNNPVVPSNEDAD